MSERITQQKIEEMEELMQEIRMTCAKLTTHLKEAKEAGITVKLDFRANKHPKSSWFNNAEDTTAIAVEANKNFYF